MLAKLKVFASVATADQNDEMEKRHTFPNRRNVFDYLLFNPLCKQSIALLSLLALFAMRHVFAQNKHRDDDSEIAFDRTANFTLLRSDECVGYNRF